MTWNKDIKRVGCRPGSVCCWEMVTTKVFSAISAVIESSVPDVRMSTSLFFPPINQSVSNAGRFSLRMSDLMKVGTWMVRGGLLPLPLVLSVVSGVICYLVTSFARDWLLASKQQS